MNKKLENVKKSIENDIRKEWKQFQFIVQFFVFLLIIGGIISVQYPNLIIFFILGCAFGLLWIITSFFEYRVKRSEHIEIIKHIEEIQDFNSEKGTLYNKESFEVILDKIRIIYRMIKLLKKYHHQKRELFFYNKRIISKNLLLEHIQFYYGIIKQIQSNLLHQLSKHKSTLEQAKSEVSTHIHGTDTLNQVSELQRQRLDQQIEQFEELQRVLVKV